jgi:hypothetical protein
MAMQKQAKADATRIINLSSLKNLETTSFTLYKRYDRHEAEPNPAWRSAMLHSIRECLFSNISAQYKGQTSPILRPSAISL